PPDGAAGGTVRALSGAPGEAGPARRRPVRRTAAAACHLPGAGRASLAPAPRRADRRDPAVAGCGHRAGAAGLERPRYDDPARRAVLPVRALARGRIRHPRSRRSRRPRPRRGPPARGDAPPSGGVASAAVRNPRLIEERAPAEAVFPRIAARLDFERVGP